MNSQQSEPVLRAAQSLDGLSVCDALGAAFGEGVAANIARFDGEHRVLLIDAQQFLARVLEFVTESETRDGIERAMLVKSTEFDRAVRELGTGEQVSSQDTVPFCLWCVAHQRSNFEEAIWQTIAGGGDRDTTCAIVGGIVALTSKIPDEWLNRREVY